jgi:hypothetical protein
MRFPSLIPLAVLLLAPLVRPNAAENRPTEATVPYSGWRHSGSIYFLTTPEGANLPATASEDGFLLLVRLHRDFFDFSQAKAGGEDLRFSTSAGLPLAYQIEEWDPVLASQFYLDGEKGKITSSSASGHVVRLQLTATSAARKLTYLDSQSWSQSQLLRGENGLAALTFCEVPILPPKPAR